MRAPAPSRSPRAVSCQGAAAAGPQAAVDQLNVALALCRWLQPLLRIAPVRAAACAIMGAGLPRPPASADPAAALAAMAAPCEVEQFAHSSARPALRALCARMAPPALAPQYGPPPGKKARGGVGAQGDGWRGVPRRGPSTALAETASLPLLGLTCPRTCLPLPPAPAPRTACCAACCSGCPPCPPTSAPRRSRCCYSCCTTPAASTPQVRPAPGDAARAPLLAPRTRPFGGPGLCRVASLTHAPRPPRADAPHQPSLTRPPSPTPPPPLPDSLPPARLLRPHAVPDRRLPQRRALADARARPCDGAASQQRLGGGRAHERAGGGGLLRTKAHPRAQRCALWGCKMEIGGGVEGPAPPRIDCCPSLTPTVTRPSPARHPPPQRILEVMLDGVCLVTSGAIARLSAAPAPAAAFNTQWAGPLAAHRRAVGDLNTATHHSQLARAALARPELFEGRLLVALGGVQVNCGGEGGAAGEWVLLTQTSRRRGPPKCTPVTGGLSRWASTQCQHRGVEMHPCYQPARP
jgi:hypothetical protein